ncbi:hypothetical protein JYU34_008129 [Plutella xylostella]|uniref:Uncharacterized protein n=1 Tax=Plutella xylostella TaxID=51655 RepID=A0ABQ7QNS8_PLUXY|nr:hypothetical protein JYU34_008129 [Plutella xylostella]
MIKLLILLSVLLCCVIATTYPPPLIKPVNNVHLVDSKEYYLNMVRDTWSTIEKEHGWFNFKLKDIVQDVQESIYGFELNGTVTYKNGFLKSLHHMSVADDGIQQVWTCNAYGCSVMLRGSTKMADVDLVFDVEVSREGKEPLFYSSTYRHSTIEFNMNIIKNYTTSALSVESHLVALSAGKDEKMTFHPSDHVTQLIQRGYKSSLNADAGVSAWATDIIVPAMKRVMGRTRPFPDLCYNCPAKL